MKVSIFLAASVVVLGTSPAAAAGTAALAEAISAFNRSDLVLTPITITDVATGTDAPWSPASGTLPASLSLSQREAEALTAAVAAYGVDQDIYKRKPRRSALAYLAYLAGIVAAVVVNNAIEQNAGFPNDEQKWQRMNTPATGGERARPLDAAPKPRWDAKPEGFKPRSAGFKSHGGSPDKPGRATGFKSHGAEGKSFAKPKPAAPKVDAKDTSKRFVPPKKK